MNRNQRIVVSIVGIIIVTLALIGITYAYFMTKIIGNPTSTSISGTLANLELTYDDGNGIIAPDDPIMPGKTLEKTFSVQNTGTADVDNYAVVFESVSNTLTRKGDLVYTLTCTSSDSNPCNGVNDAIFPSDDEIIVLNSIPQGVTQNYTLTVTYKNYDDVDQSDDMGASFSAKVNIKDKNEANPYADNPNNLAYKILNNAINGTNGVNYLATPKIPVGYISTYRTENEAWATDRSQGEFGIVANHWYILYDNKYEFDATKGFKLVNPKINTVAEAKKGGNVYYLATAETLDEANEFFSKELTYDIPYLHKIVDDKFYSVLGSLSRSEDVLSSIADSYGTSYYYRGDIDNNFVDFANMCWRVVRIQGDGSIKLILNDSKRTCSSSNTKLETISGISEMSADVFDYANCSADTCMRKKLQNWYKTSGLSNYESKLKKETWYLGDISTFYDSNGIITADTSKKMYTKAYKRLYGLGTEKYASLIDKQNGVTDFVGSLSADEAVLAGLALSVGSSQNFMNFNNDIYLLTLATTKMVFSLREYAYPSSYSGYGSFIKTISFKEKYMSAAPMIVLLPNTTVTGQGTKSDPYVVQ